MSWKAFSLRKKPPSSPDIVPFSDRGKSLKRGDEKRIMLMQMVKEGKLSVDNAVQKAYGMGIASVPYEELDQREDENQKKAGEVYNFGVYKYSKNNKSVKCVLQIDCQEDSISLLQRGQKQKSYSFTSIKNVDTADDSTSVFIHFNDATEIEIDAGSFEEKNQIARLILSIVGQLHRGQPVHTDSFAQRRRTVLKEGVLEKKGRSAAFLVWAKRYVRITDGELLYFKTGDESDDSAALSIITLTGGTFIRKIEDNAFLLIIGKKEYVFRLPGSRHGDATEKERDDWIIAIQEAAKPPILKGDANSNNTAFDQEAYLKGVVRCLNQELEQLGVMLTIIDAPIRASTQVKKVREIVHSLNEQIQTGLLSWTIRHADRSANVDRNAIAEEVGPLVLNGHTYYNQRYPEGGDSSYGPDNNVHFQGGPFLKEQIGTGEEKGYDLLNLSNLQYQGQRYAISNNADKASSYPRYDPAVNENVHETAPEYATISTAIISDRCYYNLQNHYLKEGDEAPPLPPKLSEEELNAFSGDTPSRNKVYQTHTFQQKPETKTDEKEPSSNLQSAAGMSSDAPEVTYSSDAIPAPPPIPGSVPPPPPLIGLATSLLPQKEDIIPTSKMKPLFWIKVPDGQVSSSIWKEAQNRVDQFDTGRLEKLFNIGDDTAKLDKVTPVKDKPISKVAQKTLLDPRKAQNFGIFLSGFKLASCDIDSKLCILDEEGGLSLEQISALKRFQPTTEEMEMYKSYQGNVAHLPSVDQFMHKLCQIPQLGNRLDTLLTIREIPDQLQGIEEPATKLLDACKTLFENNDFVRLLEYILSLGNYLNGGTNRGRAHGFKLSALVKLVDVRSADQKHTLLQFITEELYEVDKQCLMCYKDMPSLLLPIDVSLKGLIAEVEIMKKDIEKLLKNTKEMSNASNEFIKEVEQFGSDYLTHISVLETSCETIKGLSLLLKKKFGESPSSDFQVWMINVSNFIKQLQRAVESVEHKQRRASNRKQELKKDVVANQAPAVVDTFSSFNQFADHLNASSEPKKTNTDKSKSLPLVSPAKDSYEEVTEHSTKIHENRSATRPHTKIFTLKHATVIERQKSSFESDDELSFPVKNGYLHKLSGGKKRNPKWDRRYFEVTPAGYLHYSKKEDGKLSGAIYLRGSPVNMSPEDNCVLTIHHETREWKLRGENELHMMDWYNVLIYYSQMDEIDV